MLNTLSKRFLLLLLLVFGFIQSQAQIQQVPTQTLGMKEAVQTGLENYGNVKAKINQLNSAKAQLTETKTEYLPDLTLSIVH